MKNGFAIGVGICGESFSGAGFPACSTVIAARGVENSGGRFLPNGMRKFSRVISVDSIPYPGQWRRFVTTPSREFFRSIPRFLAWSSTLAIGSACLLGAAQPPSGVDGMAVASVYSYLLAVIAFGSVVAAIFERRKGG